MNEIEFLLLSLEFNLIKEKLRGMRMNSCFLCRIRYYQGKNIMNEVDFLLSRFCVIRFVFACNG